MKEEKYKDGYFEHWLAMYEINKQQPTAAGVANQIIIYKCIEGDKTFMELKEEVKQILLNNDLDLFLNNKTKKPALADLELMANAIITCE